MKAKARLMLSILEPMDHVLFIDEPELHLYQKQRRTLGRRLVQLIEEQGKQVFVVTHDATFLQGALDAIRPGSDVRLVRMVREAGTGRRGFIQATLTPQLVRARRRQEEILSILFRDRVVLVEGPKDRAFYEEAREILGIETRADIGVVPCWGLDQVESVAAFCREMHVPYRCIIDFDALLPENSEPKKPRPGRRDENKPPLDALAVLSSAGLVPDYRQTINKARAETTGHGELGSLKHRGVEANGLTTETRTEIEAVLTRFATIGIHIVPWGTVESCIRDCPEDGWVEAATELLETEAALKERLRPFLTSAFSTTPT